MGLKDWSAWLYLGLIVCVLSIFALYAMDNYAGDHKILDVIYLPAIVIIVALFGLDYDINLVGYIIFMAYGFVIGMILGWIYGKIKNRNKKV